MAISHKILVAVFHMLAKTIPFKELGEAFLDQQARQRTTTNLVRRLYNLGLVIRHRFGAGTPRQAVAVLVFISHEACRMTFAIWAILLPRKIVNDVLHASLQGCGARLPDHLNLG